MLDTYMCDECNLCSLGESFVSLQSKTYAPGSNNVPLFALKSLTSGSCPHSRNRASLVVHSGESTELCLLLVAPPQAALLESSLSLQYRQSPRLYPQLPSSLCIFSFLQISLTHRWSTSTSWAVIPKSPLPAPNLFPRDGLLPS